MALRQAEAASLAAEASQRLGEAAAQMHAARAVHRVLLGLSGALAELTFQVGWGKRVLGAGGLGFRVDDERSALTA